LIVLIGGYKLNKRKYIDAVIGEILFPLGFDKVKGASDWECRKELINKKNETIILSVTIYKHTYIDALSMQLWSTANGHVPKDLKDLPGCEANYGGYITYMNDEEFKEVIALMGKVLKDYGIAWLEGAIEPVDDDYLKEADYRKLYLEHDQLADSFAERMNVNIQDILLREAFDVVEKVVIHGAEKSFKEMVPLFLEMSAFLAKVMGKRRKYEWRLEEYDKRLSCYLYAYNLAGTTEENIMVMHAIEAGWGRKGNGLIKKLIEMFSLPPDGYVPKSKLKS